MMEKDYFSLSFPAKAEYVLPVRLFVSGIATRMDFSLDEIEDVKTAVSEGCNLLMLDNVSEYICLKAQAEEDRLSVNLSAPKVNVPDAENPDETETLLSKTILEALTDSLVIDDVGKQEYSILMTFKRALKV